MSTNQDVALRAVLQFDDGDLADNRNGELSIEQDVSIQKKQRKEAKREALMLLLVGILILIIGDPFKSLSLVDLVYILPFIYWVWHVFSLWQRYSRDLSAGSVEYVEGLVVQNPKQRNRYIDYSIQVAGQEFKVDGKTMLAFQNGAQYRVYYVPNSKTIVAAESLS